MTELTKINLEKTLTSLKIISTVAGFLVACVVVYGGIDARMDKLEQAQSRFEGIIEERTRNTQEDVRRIYDIVKEWKPE